MSKHGSGDHFLRQNLKRDYPVMVRGQGSYLWDDQKQQYLDGASGGVGAVLIGHAVPEVGKAMAEQAAKLCHAHISQFVNEPQIQLANTIVDHFAPPGMSHVYFVSTGTEANELAVKLARIFHDQRGANGLDGDATAIKPPLPTSREDLDKILDLMTETLTEVQKNYL